MLADLYLVTFFPSPSPTYYSGDIKSEPLQRHSCRTTSTIPVYIGEVHAIEYFAGIESSLLAVYFRVFLVKTNATYLARARHPRALFFPSVLKSPPCSRIATRMITLV